MAPENHEPAPGFLGAYLPYLMSRAACVISERFHNHIGRLGVAVPVWRVLAALAERGGQDTVNGLTETCMALQPTMSKLLRRMETEGLLTRTTSHEDRRVVLVSLTPAGQRLATELCATAQDLEQAALSGMATTGVATTKATLRQLLEQAGPSRPGASKETW